MYGALGNAGPVCTSPCRSLRHTLVLVVTAWQASAYLLRPEVSESLFILHQLTGNPVYREWGWKIFQAIEHHCKTTYGYGSYPDVNQPGSAPNDKQESFFFAETLKYLYLLQSPTHTLSLQQYVLNTEAHPFKVGL